MKIKTRELEGTALDWAVHVAQGCPSDLAMKLVMDGSRPSSSWQQGGPILEEYKVWLSPPVHDEEEPYGWDAEFYDAAGMTTIGTAYACPTPLIAVMRAIVRAKLGRRVDIPEELL